MIFADRIKLYLIAIIAITVVSSLNENLNTGTKKKYIRQGKDDASCYTSCMECCQADKYCYNQCEEKVTQIMYQILCSIYVLYASFSVYRV